MPDFFIISAYIAGNYFTVAFRGGRKTIVLSENYELEPLEVAGGATRGTVLHNLMEEVLTGETSDDVNDFHMENTCYHA